MRRALVQFDGSNFYHKVKKLLPTVHLTHFSYGKLAQIISESDQLQVNYYVGEIKLFPGNEKSERMYSSQQSLFSHLRKENLIVKKGYLLRSSGVFHEKGVDVHIAVDMAVGAVKNAFDICYLFSSDTDLLPAIKVSRKEGKRVVYVAFEGFISKALKNQCTSHLVLSKEDLLAFCN